MNRKLAIVLVVGLLCAVPALAEETSDKDLDLALDTLNDAFIIRDIAALKRFLADDHMAVTPYYGGPVSRDQQLKSLPDLKLTQYSADNMQKKWLGKEAVIITYSLTAKGTFKGKPLAPTSFTTAVWVKRNGKWQETFYQETALSGDEK